ncbi:bifunctional DNA primase/polymerase [Bradyrhizobium sp. LLZ17]|uniref:Bifunctional DNA primase/polymerase n=1 Tax=Bradyrhizobium sp. LLZ17 TaxID=3239388 RepID=A0AB39XEQ5_9BRAD
MKGFIATMLDYAKYGYFIFPAKFAKKQKLSHTSAGKSNGNPWGYTKDPDEISEYWRRWPHAAIGLPTGPMNGLFVIDVDTPDGHDQEGRESLMKLEMRYGALPRTRMAESPTGSKHYYFKQPPDVTIPCSVSKLGPGIDVRGNGGFVIAPPSVRPKRGEYKWINHALIADAPKWLLDLVAVRSHVLKAIVLDPKLRAIVLKDAGKGVSLLPEDNPPVYATMSAEDLELKIRVALSVIPSDDYDLWYRIGAAICAALGEAGYSLFDEWSRSSSKYEARACERKWRYCRKLRSIRVETIFWRADRHDRRWRTLYRRLLSGEVAA